MRVADLHHPHVAQVLDAGTLGDGTPFVVMERLAGMTLDEAVGGRSLPMTEVLPILRGVGSALCAAHAAGVAHGELRADNVFIADLAPYGPACPKLLDFGVARLVPRAHAIGRGAHELGRRAGERADQLALATLAWRLLGAMPAPAIQRVLLRAMSPDPRQRFGSVTALVEALEESAVNAARWLDPECGRVETLSTQHPVSPIASPALSLAASCRPPPTAAPTPALASAPSSLTQQFFAEGEQLEIEHAAGETSDARAVAERDEEGPLETGAAPRVPRSRAQMTAAALLALGSVAIIGWTVVSLASKPAVIRARQMPHRPPLSRARLWSHPPDGCVRLGPPTEVWAERCSRSVGHQAHSRRPSPRPQDRRSQRLKLCQGLMIRQRRFPAWRRPDRVTMMSRSPRSKRVANRMARPRRRVRLKNRCSRPPRQATYRQHLLPRKRPHRPLPRLSKPPGSRPSPPHEERTIPGADASVSRQLRCPRRPRGIACRLVRTGGSMRGRGCSIWRRRWR